MTLSSSSSSSSSSEVKRGKRKNTRRVKGRKRSSAAKKKRLKDTKPFVGRDKTVIRQYFQPDNTDKGIRYSLAHFTLGPDKRSVQHKMKSSEVYFILEGRGKIVIDDKSYRVEKEDVVYIPPLHTQYIKNTGRAADLKFLCIVDPAWREEDEIIVDS